MTDRASISVTRIATAATLLMIFSCASTSTAYWIPISGEATLLRSQGTPDDETRMIDALESYRERDALAAVEELKGFETPATDPTVKTLRDLYLASALLNAGHPQEALTTLEPLQVDYMPQPWRDHARWVQFMALKETGQTEEAYSILEDLAAEPGKSGEKARSEMKHRPKTSPDSPSK